MDNEQAHNSVYQKLEAGTQDTRRQLKLSFPTQFDRKNAPADGFLAQPKPAALVPR